MEGSEVLISDHLRKSNRSTDISVVIHIEVISGFSPGTVLIFAGCQKACINSTST